MLKSAVKNIFGSNWDYREDRGRGLVVFCVKTPVTLKKLTALGELLGTQFIDVVPTSDHGYGANECSTKYYSVVRASQVELWP